MPVIRETSEESNCPSLAVTALVNAVINSRPRGSSQNDGGIGVKVSAMLKTAVGVKVEGLTKTGSGVFVGKAVGGGVGLAAACDYCMATKHASIRLSELAVGIGPFVIGPVVERKIGLSAFSQMAINATERQTAEWGKQKGLFTEAFETIEQLDAYIEHFTSDLVKKNPAALFQLKKVFWEGTEHWDNLLERRAEMSGQLILSDFAKDAIQSFLQS